ncbi:MAG: glutathione S-transferase N-terminal domain-containing protein [Pseudomonadota bacterium]
MKLYDLALADIDVRPSPFCWLAKFALLHRGVEFETVPLRFAEKENYPNPEHAKLPILVDGETVTCDSANIVAYVDKMFPGDPFTQTDGERASADFYQAWLGAQLFPALAPMLMIRVWAASHEDDKEFFRKTREERFGKTLEELAMTPGAKDRAETALQTLAAPLARHKFLGGETPNISDYIVMSPLMWKRSITSDALYEMPQAVEAWKERMLDLFDGYARNAKSVSG